MSNCQRSGCNNPLKTGTKYCSPKCSAIAREEEKQIKLENVRNSTRGIIDTIKTEYPEVYSIMLEEGKVEIPMPVEAKTYGDLVLSFDEKEEYRPEDQLTFEAIERLRKSGPVVFAMEMKRARLLSVFADGRYVVDSPDKELAEVAMAGLRQVLPRIANDFTYSSFVWGVSFQEQMWQRKSKYELGLSSSKSGVKQFIVPKVFASVSPMSVTKIFREKGRFNGFEQQPLGVGHKDPVKLTAQESLVIPYREEFRRLWGPSFLEPLYPLWITYERVLRAMIRYMDRMAVPIVVGKAPAKGMSTIPGSTTTVKNLQYALTLALSLAKSNAVAIPSDVDESGIPLWSLEYLTSESRQQSFIDVLEFLTQEMVRAALSADRSLSQSSGGVGSYNIGEIHAEASSAAAEMLLINFVHYINKYFMPYFGLYNRGTQAPPIYLKTQPVTTREQAILMTLLQQGASSPAGTDFFNAVDWRALAEVSNIPIMAEGEEFKPPKPPAAPKPQVVQDPTQIPAAEAKALEGGYLVLSYDDIVSAMAQKKSDVITLAAQSAFDETIVKRDATGKFAKKAAGKSPQDDARAMAIKSSLDKALKDGLISQEEYDSLSKLADFSFQLKERINSPEDLQKMLQEDFGYDGEIEVVDKVSAGLITDAILPGTALALYSWEDGKMQISQATMTALMDGNLDAYETVSHEAMHNRQGGADRGLGIGEGKIFGNILSLSDLNPLTTSKRVGHQEGINQLMTLRAMSDKIGTPITSGLMNQASVMISDSRYDPSQKSNAIPVYLEQTRYAANVVSDLAAISGRTTDDVLSDLHSHGNDYPYQQEQLYKVYKTTLPSWPSAEVYNKTLNHEPDDDSSIERILRL